MAFSMTGYGRCVETLHSRSVTVEIKSVNSRYFEYYSRLPRNCGFLDDPLKKAAAGSIGRGKVELNVQVQALESGETQVEPNLAVAGDYRRALGKIAEQLEIPDDVSTSVLARLPDVFTLLRVETDQDQLIQDVLEVAHQAIERFNEMRQQEGGKLQADIRNRLALLDEMVTHVERDSENRVEQYTQRLMERLQEVLGDTTIDESRMLTEAAIFADKTAVDEETVRLRSHLKQYHQILDKGGQMGRKLDFLTQELNREINTIGSKCQDVEITRLVVDMKAEVEKIREQVQNIE